VAEKSGDSKVDSTEEKEHKVELLLKLKFHEEGLLAQRLAVFLVTSSILFLSFVQVSAQLTEVAKAVSIAGIVTCVVAFIHGRRVKNEMDRIDGNLCTQGLTQKEQSKQSQYTDALGIEPPNLDFKDELKSIFRGRSIFLWLSLVFGGLWGFSICYAFNLCSGWPWWTFGPPVAFLITWFGWGAWERKKKRKNEKESDSKSPNR